MRRPPKRNTNVGGDEPRTPAHSLPSYHEPTPETHRRLTREQEAELALLNTSFAPATRGVLIVLFLLTIAAAPLTQLCVELRQHGATTRLPMFDVFKLAPSWAQILSAHRLSDWWHLLPRAPEIKTREKTLERDSVVSQALLPRVQSVLTGTFGAGNEQVYPGRDGWLFYRPDVDYVTGAPFLAPEHLKTRRDVSNVQPDSIRAIKQFRDALANRGIALVVMPVPVKPQVEGEKLAASTGTLQNASFEDWKQQLTAAGVRVFDPLPFLQKRKAELTPLYLKTDSHWRPETMELVANELASYISLTPNPANVPPDVTAKRITALGDIAAMLKLPQKAAAPEDVTIHEVTQRNAPWRSSPDGDLLFMGDSFANIFSLEAMGWGESAGLAEHLSRALGRPIDSIVRNSDGAFATREILQRELARGRDRLAGKRLVVWEFAARELAIGDWKILDMTLGAPQPARFLTLKAGEPRDISGTVDAVSSVPRAGSVPYKDHIMSIHLVDVNGGSDALIYTWSMRDNVWTSAARIRPGDHITLKGRAWTDVAGEFEKFNRSEIDDPAVQMEEPVWGELVR